MSDAPEFSRIVDRRGIGDAPVVLEADEAERAALAERFGLVAIHALTAEIALEPDGEEVSATGTLSADIVQSCAVTGDDLASTVHDEIAVRFVPARDITPADPDDEIELDESELDEIPYVGTGFDLGEAVAQSLALAFDPFATGPDADRVRREQGLIEEGESGPLADALRGLRKD